jgi:type II secretory pathway pseudopilin PulG
MKGFQGQSNCGLQPPAQAPPHRGFCPGGRARWLGEITECGIKNSKSEIRNRQSAMGNRGFTLIEIIVLIVMAGILLPAIIVPFATGIKGSGKPEMVTTAMYLGHQKMEEFMKFDYSNPALNPIGLTLYVNADISTYQWQWQIEWVVPDSVSNNFNSSATYQEYKRILVRVKDPENDAYEIYSVVTNFP